MSNHSVHFVVMLHQRYIKRRKASNFNFRKNIAIVQYLMKLYTARWNVVLAGLDSKFW